MSKDKYPTQYSTNNTYFYDFDLYVDENVLIPRPETELLCEIAIKEINHKFINNNPVKILDIGTGSGAIAITMAKHIKNSIVTAVDISKPALIIAKKNAKQNNVDAKIKFIYSNIFSKIKDKYDIIISNPPYVLSSEMDSLPMEVKYEPAIALDGGNDGLVYYRQILKNAKNYLNDNAMIFLEIHEHKAKEIVGLANEFGFCDVEVRKDYCQRDRFVVVWG